MNKKSVVFLLAVLLVGSSLLGAGNIVSAKEENLKVVTFINIHNG